MLGVIFFIHRRRMKKKYDPSILLSRSISYDPSGTTDQERGSSYFGVHLFTYNELEVATNNFDSAKELGDGGFGTVYYGKIERTHTQSQHFYLLPKCSWYLNLMLSAILELEI